ncbi:hypothetical protein FRO38_RS06620 [Enterococcus hirae]
MPEISNETFTEQQPAGIVKKEEITEKRKKELDKLVGTIEVSLAGKLKGKTYEEIVESVVSKIINKKVKQSEVGRVLYSLDLSAQLYQQVVKDYNIKRLISHDGPSQSKVSITNSVVIENIESVLDSPQKIIEDQLVEQKDSSKPENIQEKKTSKLTTEKLTFRKRIKKWGQSLNIFRKSNTDKPENITNCQGIEMDKGGVPLKKILRRQSSETNDACHNNNQCQHIVPLEKGDRNH